MSMVGSDMAGRVAIVTGGASGIGAEIARSLRGAGAEVVVFDRNADLAHGVAAALDAHPVVGDATVEDDVAAACAAAMDRFGRLDCGVNCAGFATFAPIVDLDAGEWRSVVDVCLTGTFLAIKHEARVMRASAHTRAGAGASIVSIASLNARQPAEGMSAYCASKAAVEMLTKVAAMELGPDGIRVNAIAPGLIDTPLTSTLHEVPPIYAEFVANAPLGRSGTTADVAGAAMFLLSNASSWMTGDLLIVDGGAHTKRYPELMKIFAAMAPPET
jgi:3-oxoacyl-[acyl-carrier protein] reductase